jgi:hypothetical protein
LLLLAKILNEIRKERNTARKTCIVCAKKLERSVFTEASVCPKDSSTLKFTVRQILQTNADPDYVSRLTGLSLALTEEIMRHLGVYSRKWVSENIGALSNIPNVKLAGIGENYDNPKKRKHRSYIVEELLTRLAEEPIHYLGLPHSSMLDYLEAATKLHVIPSESLAVERKEVIFNALASWVKHSDAFSDGSLVAGLRVFHGRMSEALVKVDGCYNFVNFDFTGPWTHEVETSVTNLFRSEKVSENAVLAITLAESTRWIKNPNYPLVTDFHRHFVKPRIQRIARKYGYSTTYLWHHRYKEGSIHPMITIAFVVTKKKKASDALLA